MQLRTSSPLLTNCVLRIPHCSRAGAGAAAEQNKIFLMRYTDSSQPRAVLRLIMLVHTQSGGDCYLTTSSRRSNLDDGGTMDFCKPGWMISVQACFKLAWMHTTVTGPWSLN